MVDDQDTRAALTGSGSLGILSKLGFGLSLVLVISGQVIEARNDVVGRAAMTAGVARNRFDLDDVVAATVRSQLQDHVPIGLPVTSTDSVARTDMKELRGQVLELRGKIGKLEARVAVLESHKTLPVVVPAHGTTKKRVRGPKQNRQIPKTDVHVSSVREDGPGRSADADEAIANMTISGGTSEYRAEIFRVMKRECKNVKVTSNSEHVYAAGKLDDIVQCKLRTKQLVPEFDY